MTRRDGAFRDAGARRGPDRHAGRRAGATTTTRPSRCRLAFSTVEHGSIPRPIQRVLDGGWRIEGRRVVVRPPRARRVRVSSRRRMTVDEQLAYLTKGCVDVVRAGRAAREARAFRRRQAADGEGRVRSDRAGSAPGPHRAASEDEALSGPRPSRGLPHRRLHRPDRRSDGPIEDAAAAHAEEIARQRRDVQGAGLQDSRSAGRRWSTSTRAG